MLTVRASGMDVTMGAAFKALLLGVDGDDRGVLECRVLLALMELVSKLVFYGISSILELVLHLLGVLLIELLSIIGAIALGVVAERIGTCINGRLSDNTIEKVSGIKVFAYSI